MASTDHLNCTTQPKLKKLAATTVLAGALIGVHFDEPAIGLDARSFDANVIGVGFASDGHQ